MLSYPLSIKRRLSDGSSQTVGRLAEDKTGVYFQYQEAYLQHHSQSLSPFRVKLTDTLQKAPLQPHYGLHGVFADSLPDGWGLYLMDRVFRQHGYDPRQITALERLAYIGNRCLGALYYEPEMEIPDEPKNQDIDLVNLGREAIAEFEGTESHLLEHLMNAGGSGGARPKLNVTQREDGTFTTQQNAAGEHLIVKLTSDKFELGNNESLIEYIYLKMAKAIEIDVPDFELLNAGGDRFWLKQKRFDCIHSQGRKHMISACGLLDASFREPSLDYVDLIKATRILCGTKAAQQMVKRALFNFLMCNQDDHSKNFSFLCDDDDQWQLSPAYDLVYTPSRVGEHMTAFNGNGKQITKKALELMAGNAGFANTKPLEKMMEEIYCAAESFDEQAKNLGIPAPIIKEISNRVRLNWQSLNDI